MFLMLACIPMICICVAWVLPGFNNKLTPGNILTWLVTSVVL
jgi:hypothetical protein